MASIFSLIADGKIPCYKVAENDHYIAFLDINPLREGHTLVIPKREEDYLFDLGDDEIANIMVFAKKVARAIDQVIDCERVGVAVIGLEVPHAHIHLVPIDGIYDIDFSKPKLKLSEDEFSRIAKEISEAVI